MTLRTRRRFRLTIRARITLSVALLFALGGGIIVAGLNVFMRFGPEWALPVSDAATAPDAPDVILETRKGIPSGSNEPLPDGWPDDAELLLTMPSLEIRDVTDVFDTLLWSSVVVLLVIVVLGALAAWLLAGRLLGPLQTINEAARAATPGKLDRRVGLRGPRDELTELSDTFDEMLSRLDRAFRAQQMFAANASHELRTPLATEKAMLDMLLDGPEPSRAEYREVAQRLRVVNARSIAMGEALLELTRSQVEPGEHSARGLTPHGVAELLAEPLARVRESAAERGLDVATDISPHTIPANPEMLGRLLDNLLGNAARYAVVSGEASTDTIWLSWEPDGDESVLRVQNLSQPLDSETRQRLHEPFVRAGGRVRAEAGSGLGLAIASAVAHAHGGSLRVLGPEGAAPFAGDVERFTVERFTVEVRLPR